MPSPACYYDAVAATCSHILGKTLHFARTACACWFSCLDLRSLPIASPINIVRSQNSDMGPKATSVDEKVTFLIVRIPC